jgi:DNA ligase (NAD+)
MNIDKLGEKITEQLIDYGLVKNYADIYKLDKKQLLTLERQGEKSVENILKSIEKSKFTDLHRFLFALGIRFVGEQTARILANEFKSIENLLKSDEPTLLSLNDIGPKVTHSILQTLANDQFLASLHELLEQGITFKTIKENESNSIKKETFVITGSFTVPRDEIKNTLLAKGFRVSQSISKNTTYLLVGDKAGSKLEKAQKLGINVLTLEDFVTKFNISFEKN